MPSPRLAVRIRFDQGVLTGGGRAADGPTQEPPESFVASAARRAAPLAADSGSLGNIAGGEDHARNVVG
jgi:hypothetical protein